MRRGAAELLRFGLVSTLGLGVDLSVAYGLAALLEISLPLAALAGFLAGAALNYALHHLWTFRAVSPGAGDDHARRMLRYAAGLALTLAVRVAAVALLERLLPGRELAALAGGTVVSFVVNYLSSKHFVFRPIARRAPDLR